MLGFFGLPGGTEWIIILVIALLLFGRRLPSVMRSMGKGVSEFKRGLRDVEDEINSVGEGEEEDEVRQLPEGENEYESAESAEDAETEADEEDVEASRPAE